MSIVETSVASDAAIPSKAATDVRYSSFHGNPLTNGHDLIHNRVQNHFNSIIYQIAPVNWAPFPTRRREGEGMGLNS